MTSRIFRAPGPVRTALAAGLLAIAGLAASGIAVAGSGAAIAAEERASARIAPDASTFTLSNGLEVVVVPDHRAPIVTQMVWYKIGAADDPPGKSGIAHFLEHLMFKGTKAHPIGEFSNKVSEGGGAENAFTTNDATAFYQTIGKDQLGTVMAYEADRMENLVLTDAVVLPERDVILEERRMRIDNDPGAQLSEAMSAALFQNHHYGIPTIGWAEEMATLSREDAIAQYEHYYTPNNAILVVAGDVKADEVRKMAEATFGQVPRRAAPGPRHRPLEPVARAERTVTMTDARVSQPYWSRIYLVPSYASAPAHEAEALDILSDVLGGGPTSRLYRSLVVDKALAGSAGAYYAGDGLDYGRFGIVATPRGDTKLADLQAAIDAAITDIRDHGITEDELAHAKERTRASSIYAQDSQGTLARIVGTVMVSGQSLADVQDWPARIDKVTTGDVQAAAREFLDRRRSVTGTILPAPADGRS